MSEPSNSGRRRWPGGELLAALPPSAAGCMMLADLEAATGIAASRITRLITGLNRGGLVAMVRKGCYRRTEAGDALVASGRGRKPGPRGPHSEPRRSVGLKDKLWRALRIKRRATIAQLLEVIDHDLAHPDDVAQRYLLALATAGVTVRPRRRVAGEALTSNGHLQHVLVHDLGPKAPLIRRGRLWDLNSGRWVEELLAESAGGAP